MESADADRPATEPRETVGEARSARAASLRRSATPHAPTARGVRERSRAHPRRGPSAARTARAAGREGGASLLSLLATLVILGALVGITLAFTQSPAPTSTHGGTTAPSTAPVDVGNDANAASLAACEANFAIVESAVADYLSLHGADPPAGTAWATAAGDGGPLLGSWPGAPGHYTLNWNGSTLSVVPAKGTVSVGSYGTASPPSGCYAAG